MRRSSLVLAITCLGIGCKYDPAPYACKAHEDCRLGAVAGRCETTGYCSLPSAPCASGWAYDRSAEPTLAGTCTSGTEIVTAVFDDGTLPVELTPSTPNPDNVQVVTAPWDATKHALKLTIVAGDNWLGFGYPTTYVVVRHSADVGNLQLGTRYGIQTAFWFDPGTVFGMSGMPQSVENDRLDGFIVPSPTSNLASDQSFTIGLSFDRLFTRDIATGVESHDAGAVQTGTLVPIEIVYLPSAGDDGYMRIRIGDKTVLERTGTNVRSSPQDAGYLKLGLHDNRHTVKDALSIYYDSFHLIRY